MVDISLGQKISDKLLSRHTFVFQEMQYCLPPITFPCTIFRSPAVDLLRSHLGVISLKKFPLIDGYKETYRWWVTIRQSALAEIEALLFPYKRIGTVHKIYHTYTTTEHYKTEGFYFVQVVGNDSRINRILIDDLEYLWGSLGWQWIAKNYSCGWVSIRGGRMRHKNDRSKN